MGLRGRIKGRIKETLGGFGALARIIHDEANHPGRPQPHMAARNPLWGGGEVDDPSKSENPLNEASVESTATKPLQPDAEDADYWFLDDPEGEADDWSMTNPKKQ